MQQKAAFFIGNKFHIGRRKVAVCRANQQVWHARFLNDIPKRCIFDDQIISGKFALVSTDAGAAAVAVAAEAVAAASTPISDVRGSADYRRAMAAVIARRAIETAVARARGAVVRIPASDSTFGTSGAGATP